MRRALLVNNFDKQKKLDKEFAAKLKEFDVIEGMDEDK